ncbi:phosphoglycolate phosphatase [Pleionea sp. CnH1-48]|uniref:phosphoglycolate phosphatase n=1 Tax=Pleionea sp. CnH1-48 TaxID=2954494 RepID=UPI002096E008|nr:phosphoglycolate phosphatase [Pleionea sp. CnH1-48]MCO7223852.1 phosphoglycolate phosphatase [Pleionea sp. CnH1-48]
MNYAAVLFDLDGTFADTARDLAFALNELLVAQGRPPMTFEDIRPYVSKGTPGMLGIGFQVTPADKEFEPLKQRFLAIYQRAVCRHTVLFDGIEKLITDLESAGIPWGIITNKPDFLTQPLIKALELDERAAVVYSGDTFGEKKPHPLPLLEAAKTLNVDALNCVYVGDDERDMMAAKAAGMKAVAALWGYIPPQEDPQSWPADSWVENSEQLQEALTQLSHTD